MEQLIETGIEVMTTTDYELFKILGGNRTIKPKHVIELKESFSKKYLISPILVNEEYEIIDGQHRYLAAQDLNLPIHYIICKGYGLQEVQMLNSINKKWTAYDYLHYRS